MRSGKGSGVCRLDSQGLSATLKVYRYRLCLFSIQVLYASTWEEEKHRLSALVNKTDLPYVTYATIVASVSRRPLRLYSIDR